MTQLPVLLEAGGVGVVLALKKKPEHHFINEPQLGEIIYKHSYDQLFYRSVHNHLPTS